MTPVSFTDRYGALLQGDVFAPKPGARDPYTGRALTGPFPGVVITTGSVQGSERMYWWLAQDLAERGYVVLTYDVQGQGRSETFPHTGDVADLPYCDLAAPPAPGEQTSCPEVPAQQTSNFVYGTEDAIDFFLSTPSAPYGNPGAGSAPVNRFNPLWDQFDRSPDPASVTPGRTTRLALVGHSLGALAVSYVQGVDNRVEAVVALDKLSTSTAIGNSPEFTAQGPLKPVVPGLGVQSEYGFTVAPYFANPGLFNSQGVASPTQAPDPNREEKTGYDGWKTAGVDSMVIVPRASTHLEYTDIAYVLPASRYGQDVASHYTQGWLGKYLQHDPAADGALLATSFDYLEPTSSGAWKPITLNRADRLSFYFCSGYDIGTASGRRQNDDIAGVGCS
jgi:dienelactone hydrolase